MEEKSSRHIATRLRNVQPPNISATSTSTAGEVNSHCSSSISKNAIQPDSIRSSSDSDSDDFATIHFKLAAALEVAAAHASGLRFDWQSMKNTLMSGASNAVFTKRSKKASKQSVKKTAIPDDVASESLEQVTTSMDASPSTESDTGSKEKNVLAAYNSDTKKFKSSASNSISSDNDDVSNILLPLFSKPLAAAMQFSNLTSFAGIVGCNNEDNTSVLDDPHPMAALSKILDRMPFNPFDADLVQMQFVFKSIVSLNELSMREDNIIEMDIKKSSIAELSKRKNAISPFMDVSNLLVKHNNDEFFTFCSCSKCLEYREIVFHVMVEQFKAAHMVVMLLDVLIKTYGPMLKNVTAYNKFEKLLEANKEIYWITCGLIYSKKAEHMNFIYDESLSDHMILVLFSSILMANNPILLLQILAFHVECIVKAYAEGFMEIVEPYKSQPNKTPAEEMLTYILDGYYDLCRISDHISLYLYAFENDFLHRISLTWTLLCQRLYQQHVYINLTDTMLGCIITLKEDVLTARNAALIKKYIKFDEKMNYVDRCWTKAWIELNKVNLSERERKRRKSLMDVYNIFNTVIQDAIAFSLQESHEENDFYDFQTLEDRRLAWQNIMAYTKMKWPDGFFDQPNMLVCDDKCKKCYASLDYHQENCKCITCSIAGGPLPPKRDADGNCCRCLTHSLVDKEINLYESKILNVCASDDFASFMKSNRKRKSTTLEQLGKEVSATLALEDKSIEASLESNGSYHISWAVYKHISNRQRYRHTTLEERYFCQNCTLQPCLLARKILNNDISRELSVLLINYYQPFIMSREDLRAVLPSIILYNRKMIGSNVVHPVTDVQDFIVKNYWTFVISLYATYFLDVKGGERCPLNLSYFDATHNDISFRIDYNMLSIGIQGNKEDGQFLDFLDRIKRLSPYKKELISEMDFPLDVHTEEFQNELDNFLNIYEKHRNTTPSNKMPELSHLVPDKEEPTADTSTRKTCKERTKKCCYDHPDLSEHCKDTHTGRKRIKKECNHARMNETRDRLRKKLSQLMTARKNMKSAESEAQPPAEVQVAPPQPSVKQPPSLKSVATAAAAHSHMSARADPENDSLECLNSLCKRISHTCKNATNGGLQSVAPQQTNQKQSGTSSSVNSPAGKKLTSSISNNLAKDNNGVSCCLTSSTSNNINNNAITPTHGKRTAGVGVAAGAGAGTSTTLPSNAKGREDCNWDVASDIYEFIDNYSKDQTKVKKWINETLSYIEGSNNVGSNYKKQPQPTNPKKAAKKAKQKQRKEEEKRIAELHDLRGQFYDIYFKEFTDKLELKSLKVGKKRDKKKIAELEVNVKKLQRAKGKVETAILELIATVKQTNTEFKFSYLPTKEQQLAKLKELDMTGNETSLTDATQTSTAIGAAQVHPASVGVNNLNVVLPLQAASFTLPYAHANHFPYQPHPQIEFTGASAAAAGATGYGMIRPPLPTPMCYAPPPHKLTPDVVAAMAANATCNSNADPSKRIVTIRRVNLPNVPEPQVTVTAKGSSPDKDKLLYTFVNGQLVHTSATVSPSAVMTVSGPMPPLPLNTLTLPVQHGNKVLPKQLVSIPLPPSSKTQMKKERRRLAKLAAEKAQAAAEAAIVRQRQKGEAEAQQRLHESGATATSQTRSKESHEHSNSNIRQKKLKKQKLAEAQTSVPQQNTDNVVDPRTNKLKAKEKQQPSTMQAAHQQTHVLSHSLPISALGGQRCKPKKGTGVAWRSASTISSCSASTSATVTPTDSEVNTRDNSVCSSKPTVTTAPLASKKDKQGQNAAKPRQTAKSNLVQAQMPTQNSHLTALGKKPPADKLNDTPSPSQSTTPAESNASLEDMKRKRTKRQKLIDNGQFDNNPFKSLHLQDSETDSDLDLGSSCSDEVVELDLKIKEQKPENQNKTQRKNNQSAEVSRVNTSSIKLVPPSQDEVPASQSRRAQRGGTESTMKKGLVQGSKPNVRGKAECQTQPQQPQPHNQILSVQFSQRNVVASNRGKPNCQSQEPKSGRTGRKSQSKFDAQPKQQKPKLMHMQQQQQQQQPQPPALQSTAKSRGDGRHGPNSRRGGGGRRGQGEASSAGDGGSYNTQGVTGTGSNRRLNRYAISEAADGKPLSKRAQKQAQRGKKYQSHHQELHSHDQYEGQHNDCFAGIPTHMGYFNPNDLAISNPPAAPATKQYSHQQLPPQVQQQQYSNLTQQMQGLQLGNAQSSSNVAPSYASVSNSYSSAAHKPHPANVSIMDQLNRGVQVENLSLPPGITLTKVDPIKSEQLRQKSESIKKLSRPLQPQTTVPQTTFHHQSGATIIAPPVASVSGYYGAPYAGVAAGALDQHHHNGIIMVEANLPTSSARKCAPAKPNVAAAAAAASSGKSSRSKKRRNKTKSDNVVSGKGGSGGGGGGGSGCGVGGSVNTRSSNNATAAKANSQTPDGSNQPEMITLRNPMFHGGPMGAAATILQQPGLIPARTLGGLPLPTTLPMDQPAAIIKNENGMFTIRNPALHQAVTNGLTLGGYRQFGNVNYYTPQEAAAEAVRATQIQQTPETSHNNSATSFSYFSSSAPTAAATSHAQLGVDSSSLNGPGPGAVKDGNDNSTHKTISISCTSISDNDNGSGSSGGNGGLTGDAAVIARPAPQPKCISAIGSEIKSAQQHKQKCKESQQTWTSFSTDLAATISPLNTTANDSLTCGADVTPVYLGAGGNGGSAGLANATLQDKYQQSSYYNGFGVFPANSNSNKISSTGGRSSNTGSLFDGADCHMHHSCGDDSPPPTISGYNSYLEGIPNTGIIRYDDASFLKNLIPGQNLNNEVSIHNVNDSNFTRNSSSPVTHRVEITPVYNNRPPSANIFEQCSAPGAPQHPETEQQAQTFAVNTTNTANYCENLADYGNSDANLFNTNNLLNLSDLGGGDSNEQETESFKPYNYDFEAATEKQKLLLDLNDLLLKKGSHSQRTSPFLDESTLKNFVQNMNTLQISTPLDEQCTPLNGATTSSMGGGTGSTGCGSSNTGGNGNDSGKSNGSDASTSNTANGWW